MLREIDTELFALLDNIGYIFYKDALPFDFLEKMQVDLYVYYKQLYYKYA